MRTHRELIEQCSTLYLDNLEQCLRLKPNMNDIFTSTNESTPGLCEWTRSVLLNCENVCATHSSSILFITLVSLSHFTNGSMYIHWKEASMLKNINLFGLIVGLSGENIFFYFVICE